MKHSQIVRPLAGVVAGVLAILCGCSASGVRWSETESGSLRTVSQRGGQTLRNDTTSGVTLLTAYGFAFKDLSGDGTLDPYEDWRLSADERARDLASKLSIEQIAGLMLYSAHQAIPSRAGRFGACHIRREAVCRERGECLGPFRCTAAIPDRGQRPARPYHVSRKSGGGGTLE